MGPLLVKTVLPVTFGAITSSGLFDSHFVRDVFMRLVWFVPIFILCVVGIFLGILWGSRCPRPALLVIAAMVAMLANQLLSILQMLFLNGGFNQQTAGSMDVLFAIIGIVHVILYVGAISLLLVAAFVDRTDSKSNDL